VKFIEHVQIFNLFVYPFKSVGPDFLGPYTVKNNFSLLGVIPKIRLMGDAFFVFYFVDLAIVVKDTSSRQPRGPSSLSTVLWSWVKKI